MREPVARRLVGSIVVLEPLEPRHEQGLLAAASDPEVWRWMLSFAAQSEATFHAWLEEALAASRVGDEAAFATLDAGSGEAIGSTRYLAIRPEHRALEIGWTWLARSRWGTGANVEAKLLMLEHAFERLGCLRVEFKTDVLNTRSRAAIEALPARFEGISRKHQLVRGGERRDSAWYSILDEEWPDVRANLEARLRRLAEAGP